MLSSDCAFSSDAPFHGKTSPFVWFPLLHSARFDEAKYVVGAGPN